MISLDHTPRDTRAGRRSIVALSSGALTIFIGIIIWLFGATPPELKPPAGVKSLPSVDGTLLIVEQDRLVLEAFTEVDGKSRVEFTIRERDTSHFDLAHLRSHSSIALPTRLFYEQQDGELFAVYKEDAPANSSPTGPR